MLNCFGGGAVVVILSLSEGVVLEFTAILVAFGILDIPYSIGGHLLSNISTSSVSEAERVSSFLALPFMALESSIVSSLVLEEEEEENDSALSKAGFRLVSWDGVYAFGSTFTISVRDKLGSIAFRAARTGSH